MNKNSQIENIAKSAYAAAQSLVSLSSDVKNDVLHEMAKALLKNKDFIIKENRKDLKIAKVFLDRLRLNDIRIKEMARSLDEIAELPDPVGEVIKAWRMPNGLWINKVHVPIGVIAIIYESRPNVTSDCAGLCFKSGNSVILRGGSEAINSNIVISKVLQDVLKRFGIPEAAISMVNKGGRKAIDELLKLNNYIDLVIPRGGEGLIKKVTESSRIPVIKHYKGICHVYVDECADLKMANDICFNAKVQRPGVCNAMESMLIHSAVAVRFLPGMAKRFKEAGVQLRGCDFTRKIVKWAKPVTEADYRTEYLDLKLSVKIVDSLDMAVKHINSYGSRHSDAIVTENEDNAKKFLNQVDSACVYVNASTRFTDGGQFGMGAEIGISTDKLHARGPMGLEELTTYKYMIYGKGQVRNA